MLKGFVSGEEKDIVRIPMKGKNLFEGAFDGTIGSTGSITYHNQYVVHYARVTAGATYTISGGYYVYAYYSDIPSVGMSNSVDNERHFTSQGNTITVIEGATWIGVRVNAGDKPMLNAGDTALPYEPYGYQEGWEVRDNQDRILWGREDELQTSTGTLPFKGYSLPLKTKSLLGNAVQNGTPAPDNIIMPEMCGVRTGNLAPPLTEWVDGYIEGGTGTIHEPSAAQEKTSPFINIKGIQRCWNCIYSFLSNYYQY